MLFDYLFKFYLSAVFENNFFLKVNNLLLSTYVIKLQQLFLFLFFLEL